MQVVAVGVIIKVVATMRISFGQCSIEDSSRTVAMVNSPFEIRDQLNIALDMGFQSDSVPLYFNLQVQIPLSIFKNRNKLLGFSMMFLADCSNLKVIVISNRIPKAENISVIPSPSSI